MERELVLGLALPEFKPCDFTNSCVPPFLHL